MKKLKETPELIKVNGKSHGFTDKDAVPFGYYKGKMYVAGEASSKGRTHWDVGQLAKPGGSLDRDDLKFPGRYWTKPKIISFWEYPKENEIQKVIKDIEKASGLKMWNDPKWKIEVILDGAGEKQIPKGSAEWYLLKRQYTPKLIPLRVYKGTEKWSEEERGKQHVLSPIAKKTKVSKGWGSRKIPKDLKPGETMAQYHHRTKQESKLRETIKKIVEALIENPDHVNLPDKKLTTKNSFSFGYYDGNMVVGDKGQFHFNLVVKRGLVSADKQFEGKIWPKEKIISFWDYPKKNEMKKVINDLEKQLKINIWNDPKYQLELPQDKKGNVVARTQRLWNQGKNPSVLIPLRAYVGGKSVDTGTLGQRHMLSPTAKNEPVPAGVGSRKRPEDILPGETMAQYHYRKKQENTMSKLKNLLPEELLGEEERTSEWQRQNIRDMNAIIRSVNDLEKKIKDVDKELDKMENLWFSRRDTTWPYPLENLFLKGARFGSENVSLETVRFNLKSFKKWLEEVQNSAADLLKDIAKKK